MLGFFFNFILNAIYKYSRFAKILLKKGLKFVLYKESNVVLFNLNLILLLVKVDLITKKQSYKEDIFIVYGNGYVKMILTLLIKVLRLYMQAFIVQV